MKNCNGIAEEQTEKNWMEMRHVNFSNTVIILLETENCNLLQLSVPKVSFRQYLLYLTSELQQQIRNAVSLISIMSIKKVIHGL